VARTALDIIGPVIYRAVFFDAGETLLYPHPSFPELLAVALRELGHEVDPPAIRGVVQPVSERFQQAARERELWSTSDASSRRFWKDVYRILLGELGVPFTDGVFQRLYSTFTDLSNYRLFPDVEPVLAELHALGLTLGVISNFEEWLERLLGALNVVRFFEVRVISGAVGLEKPDPQIFRLALDKAGVRAEESAYVGDNPYFDVEPASSLGMYAVLVDRRGRFADHAGPRITSLEELPGMLRTAA
jgi:putative hydrolase of the HAD superfamily